MTMRPWPPAAPAYVPALDPNEAPAPPPPYRPPVPPAPPVVWPAPPAPPPAPEPMMGARLHSVPLPPLPPAPAEVDVPPPPPPPPPAPTLSDVFPTTSAQTFASLGTSVKGAVYDADIVGPVSTADADQAHIRYTSNGTYEIELPGREWQATLPQSDYLGISKSRAQGYSYSELANWGTEYTRYGIVAFGMATPTGQVPQTGSAAYHGIVGGSTDVVNADGWGSYHVPVGGSVDLNFDFAKGSLSGSINLRLEDYDPAPIGTFAFKDTVFSAGSTTYSGAFATNVPGQNSFTGQFTGPNGEETIGAWMLPFVFTTGSTSITADGKNHQAFGAWIAKH